MPAAFKMKKPTAATDSSRTSSCSDKERPLLAS